jgi:hypothetical protein
MEGQGFMCGYKGCMAISAAKGHCAKCKALQETDVVVCEQDGESASVSPTESFDPVAAKGKLEEHLAAAGADGAVDPAVCEHCSGKAAHGDSKYCEDCIAELEKALGLADEEDEEKHTDGVGGSAEPPTAPGVSVEPPSTAPDGSVEQGAAAASQTAPGCPECKGPATDGQVCAACVPKVLEAIKTQKEVERMKRDVTHATLDEFDKKTKYCGPCRSVRKCARQYCEDCNGWL